VAVHLDQQHGIHIQRQSHVGIILDALDGNLVQKLQGGRDNLGGNNGRNRQGGILQVREMGQHGDLPLGLGNQLDGDAGEETQRPLR